MLSINKEWHGADLLGKVCGATGTDRERWGGEDMTGGGGDVGPAALSAGCGTVGVAVDTLEQLFTPLPQGLRSPFLFSGLLKRPKEVEPQRDKGVPGLSSLTAAPP